MKKLIEQAKSIKSVSQNRFSDEDIELSVAWLKGEINYTQLCTVKNFKMGSPIYSFLSGALKVAYQKGIIQ